MRNAQIEIADIAGQLDALKQAFELQLKELRARQAELAEQVNAVQRSVTALQPKPAEAAKPSVLAPEPKPAEKPLAQAKAVPDSIPEEIMLVIAAAVAAFVGKSARVRSARYLHDGMSPWAQQGRVFVQASHNLAHHG